MMKRWLGLFVFFFFSFACKRRVGKERKHDNPSSCSLHIDIDQSLFQREERIRDKTISFFFFLLTSVCLCPHENNARQERNRLISATINGELQRELISRSLPLQIFKNRPEAV